MIEKLDENIIFLLFTIFTVIIVVLSWLSTNVREFAFPANLLVIERRSRRLYATTVHGNLNRIVNAHQLSPSRITTTSTPNALNTGVTVPNYFNNNNNSNQIDLVDEMVEQALVDNLLDGTYLTSNQIDLVNRQEQQQQINSNESISNDSSSVISEQITDDDDLNDDPGAQQRQSEINESNETETATELANKNNEAINILIKFVTEKEMKIKARPDDTILILKRAHFSTELSNNKIVRFIFQGQFLCDKNTIRSYNIKDQCTIHCHITSKQQQQQHNQTNQVLNDNNNSTTANIRQRLSNHQIASITRITSESGSNSSTPELNNEANTIVEGATNGTQVLPDIGNVTSMSTNANTSSAAAVASAATNISSNRIRIPMRQHNRSHHRTNQQRNMLNTATIINVDLTSIFLPFFAVLLGSFWYIRVHFKHFFTPFSTLVLILISFIYALFLFNNIYTSSLIETNSQFITNRIFNRRQTQQQPQRTTAES